MKKGIFLILLLCEGIALAAQERDTNIDSLLVTVRERFAASRPVYNADSVRREIERAPYFTLYKDNYFIAGTAIGEKMTAANSNVKFQLSISQRLTRSNLPFDTYLFIQFTQKTIWNVLEESLPMHDTNFNPGIGLGHLVVYRNKYIGNAFLLLEHESNGKDSASSRSWNKVSLGGSFMIVHNIEMQIKTWVPIIDSDNNRDILKYNGLAQVAFNYRMPNKRFNAGVRITWRARSFSFNTQWELSYKMNNNQNQYMFLQYYNGYGENLLDYNKFRSTLRFGFVIKPQNFIRY
ncbi:MAG: phospholipase A [Tannerella sp.]|jgi:phospholipase A1|nr:phospholipase A [Tannerella sp.]